MNTLADRGWRQAVVQLRRTTASYFLWFKGNRTANIRHVHEEFLKDCSIRICFGDFESFNTNQMVNN